MGLLIQIAINVQWGNAASVMAAIPLSQDWQLCPQNVNWYNWWLQQIAIDGKCLNNVKILNLTGWLRNSHIFLMKVGSLNEGTLRLNGTAVFREGWGMLTCTFLVLSSLLCSTIFVAFDASSGTCTAPSYVQTFLRVDPMQLHSYGKVVIYADNSRDMNHYTLPNIAKQ